MINYVIKLLIAKCFVKIFHTKEVFLKNKAEATAVRLIVCSNFTYDE